MEFFSAFQVFVFLVVVIYCFNLIVFCDFSDPTNIRNVLCNISVTIRDTVRDFLHEIYFLPDLPELKEIQVVLQEYRKV